MEVILDNKQIFQRKEEFFNAVRVRHLLQTKIFRQNLNNLCWLLIVHAITEKIFLCVRTFVLCATHLIKILKAKLDTKVAFTELARIATNVNYADSVKFFVDSNFYRNGNLLQFCYSKF